MKRKKTKLKLMIDDPRLIKSIDLERGYYAVEKLGVASIRPYHEGGHLWFAIVKDDLVDARINADFVISVWYG